MDKTEGQRDREKERWRDREKNGTLMTLIHMIKMIFFVER
jgi:hypothetical protein